MTRKVSQGTDDFELKMVSSFPEYNSSADPTNLAPGILVRGSYNVYKKLSGTIANRFGLKARGAYDATLAGTKSSFDWNAWDGTIRPVRINNGKLQVESSLSGSPVWYTLLSSLAASFNNSVFDAIWDNTAKKDVLVWVGGTSTMYHWSGAMALFVSATATIITLDRDATTAGFSSSGSILINGNTYTYSGISGSTLTGVNVDASGEAVNSMVMEATGSDANTPASGFTNDFLRVVSNQLYVGSYSSRRIYISKQFLYADYTYSSPRLPGEGYLITLDNNGVGIAAKGGNAWVAGGTSDWYEITFTQTVINNVLTEQVGRSKKPTSVLSAPLRHEFIDMIGDEIIVLCQDQQVRRIGQFANTFTTRYPTLSLPVQTELAEEDFTGGHLRVVGNIIHLTAPVSGRDYMHETRETIDTNGQVTAERFWHPPQVRGISRFAVIGGVLYGHSNANPMIYQVNDTGQWHDDTGTSGVFVPYSSVMLLAYQNGGRRQGKINFDKFFVEGYEVNSQLYAAIYYNYQGSEGIQNPVLNTTDNAFTDQMLFSGSVPPSLGDASLGDNPLGDGLNTAADDQALLHKFKVIAGVEQVDCFEFEPMIYTQNIDARWEILAIGANYELAFAESAEIIK